MRIFITHCSAKRDDSFKDSTWTTPDKLYTAAPTRRFMERCKKQEVEWAMFSDKYSFWFPDVEKRWYEKSLDPATVDEFADLVKDFDAKPNKYDEILFYYNPGSFRRLYRRLIYASASNGKIRVITPQKEVVR